MDEVKSVQKSIRMTKTVYNAVDGYRGEGFNEKLANLVMDYLNRRDELAEEWHRLQACINDKHRELVQIQTRVRKLREVEPRVTALVNSILDLLGDTAGKTLDSGSDL